MILVQQIETVWSKEFRTPYNATIRNSVPNILEAPPMAENKSLHQLLQFDEKSNFQMPKLSIQPLNKNKRNHFFEAIRVYTEKNQLKIIYTYSPEKVGAPERKVFPKQVLCLNKGEWGKIIYIGRYSRSFAAYTDWFYRKQIFNIAYMEKFNKLVFSDSEPKRVFQDIVDLR